MPRVVDHENRREAIVDATWRVIERGGFDRLTMREVAAEAGFANGALTPYFRDKDGLLEAAFARVSVGTATRFATAIGEAAGLDALRVLCLEIMPTSPEKVLEARVVVAFWDRALHEPRLKSLLEEAWDEHRRLIEKFLTQARTRGEVTTLRTDSQIVDVLTWFMSGLQSRVLFAPERTSARRQAEALDALLHTIVRD